MFFIEWLSSYSGCDGGDQNNSDYWVVGIEWGHESYTEELRAKLRRYHSNDMLNEIKAGFKGPHNNFYRIGDHLDYQFGQRLAALLCAIEGHKSHQYRTWADTTPDHRVFKMNLFPIALPDTNPALWEEYNMPEILDIGTKQEYMDLCRIHRFPFIRSELRKHHPKFVITFGKTLLDSFGECFFSEEDIGKIETCQIADQSGANNTPRTLIWKWLNKHTLFINAPFPGARYGLNSHDLLQKFGDKIRTIHEAGFTGDNVG